MPNKPRKKCLDAQTKSKVHRSHTWTGDIGNKLWCPGYDQEHVHIWDEPGRRDADQLILRRSLLEDGKVVLDDELWDGPMACRCGKSRFVVQGILKEERAQDGADMLERIQTLSSRFNYNQGVLDEEDQAEVQWIAEQLINTLAPLIEGLKDLVQSFALVLIDVMQSVDWAQIKKLADAMEVPSGEQKHFAQTVEVLRGNPFNTGAFPSVSPYTFADRRRS